MQAGVVSSARRPDLNRNSKSAVAGFGKEVLPPNELPRGRAAILRLVKGEGGVESIQELLDSRSIKHETALLHCFSLLDDSLCDEETLLKLHDLLQGANMHGDDMASEANSFVLHRSTIKPHKRYNCPDVKSVTQSSTTGVGNNSGHNYPPVHSQPAHTGCCGPRGPDARDHRDAVKACQGPRSTGFKGGS